MSKRPQGQPTRGKTARNRLRRVDNFVLLYDPGLLRREDGPFKGAWYVDLGYGAEPVTTLESAQRFRRASPQLPVLGVEIDPERVAAAQPYADALTQFRLGGFNLPLAQRPDGSPETVRLIRAFNVLRQYDESEVAPAWEMLARYLLPGGLLIEGTSEPFGRLWVANLLRRSGEIAVQEGGVTGKSRANQQGGATTTLQYEGLLFSTNFRLGFDPADFQAVLPKNCIHRMAPGEPIYEFMETWKRAARETAAVRTWGLRQWFGAAAHRLSALGYAVVLRPRLLTGGYLLVRLPLAPA